MAKTTKTTNSPDLVLKRNLKDGEVVYYSTGYYYIKNVDYGEEVPSFKMNPVKKREPKIFKLFFKELDGDSAWFYQSDENGNKINKKKKLFYLRELSENGLLSRDINVVKKTLEHQVTVKRKVVEEIDELIAKLEKRKGKILEEVAEILEDRISQIEEMKG
jgi:thymidylate synthase